MSTAISPSKAFAYEAIKQEVNSPFTTFQYGHYVKPATSVQPVAKAAPAVAPNEFLLSFDDEGPVDGDYGMYVAEPLDLDYDEPNAVAQPETMEFVAVGDTAIRTVEMGLSSGETSRKAAPTAEEREAA
jgi:hypothetical protein